MIKSIKKSQIFCEGSKKEDYRKGDKKEYY